MRISGGAARGIPLLVPKGDRVRPATDALRQAVFSSLAARVPGARFLDLFAGSGAYGLEALSRGAQSGVFVEKNPRALDCLRRNVAAVCKSLRRGAENLLVVPGDATIPFGSTVARSNGLGTSRSTPDLIFVDPPYELIARLAEPLFANLSAGLKAQPDALVIFELPGGVELAPAGWTQVNRLGGKGARTPNAAFFRLEVGRRVPTTPVGSE